MHSYCNIQLTTCQPGAASNNEWTYGSLPLQLCHVCLQIQFPNYQLQNLCPAADALVSLAPSKSWTRHPPSSQYTEEITATLHIKIRAYIGGDSEKTPDADDDDGDEQCEQDTYDFPLNYESQDDSIQIKIEKTGKNSRTIVSKVAVQASLQTVWDILTDYERLADFILGLAVSKLLEKKDNFARLYQIGEQNLPFGLKFNAKGTIDCFEKDLLTLPFGQKRDIEFKMVEGDFQLFEGKWSIEQGVKCNDENLRSNSVAGQEFQTTLLYVVHVKPKLWLPVHLVEGRLCKEIRTNLSCIREEAGKAFQNAHPVLQ